MKAVVMAGGEGSRLRPLTSQLPKPLLPVAGLPVMEHILNLLQRHGITEIIVTLHYLADMIEAYFGDGSSLGIPIRYVRENSPLGTAGAVKQAESLLRDETFLIVSGDALTDMDLTALIADHRERRADATIALKRVEEALAFGIAVTDDDNHITDFLEKPPLESIFPGAVNTGVYVLEPNVFDMMRSGGKYDFSHDIFPRLLEENKSVVGHISEAYWADIGTVNQYRQSCFDALNGLLELRVPGKRIRAGIYAGENTIIDESATLKGPIVLGRNVRIGANAHIEGPAIIGAESSIDEEACVTRTILWNNVHVERGATIDGGIIADHNTIEANANISSAAVRGPACETDARA